MALSPAHKLGQYIGRILEKLFLPELEQFCERRSLYIDCQRSRPGVRAGKKATWEDRYGNKHDLDFVVEKNGSSNVRGRPLAFIEAAWRRYTKHSRNKVQEIQGSVLPIAEKYAWDKPFLGAVLAGQFTDGSLQQIRSLGFEVVFIPYSDIVQVYKKNGVDIGFDEDTKEHVYERILDNLKSGGESLEDSVISDLRKLASGEIGKFLEKLRDKLDRHVDKIVICPLFGEEVEFILIDEAIDFIDGYSLKVRHGDFRRFEIVVRYSNGDKLEASFSERREAVRFLKYAAE